MRWSIRYHIGTMALGSAIEKLVQPICTIFEYLASKMENAESNNGCTRCLFSCTRCCIRIFDRYIRYVNRNAYWYCALTSEDYCQSAFNSYIL